MLLRWVLLALTSGVVLDVVASPVASAVRKREVPKSHALHERHLPHVSRRWTKREKVSRSVTLPMRIGLRQSNVEAGHDRLMDLYVRTNPLGIRVYAPHEA